VRDALFDHSGERFPPSWPMNTSLHKSLDLHDKRAAFARRTRCSRPTRGLAAPNSVRNRKSAEKGESIGMDHDNALPTAWSNSSQIGKSRSPGFPPANVSTRRQT
jgi:hypothetical protein